MRTARWALLAAAAAILPSCGDDHHRVWVTIHNDGTVAASYWVEGHYQAGMWGSVEEHEGTVQPGESASFRFDRDDMYRLELRIYRSTDMLKLFEDSWDRGDLDDVDYVVTVTVEP